MIYCGDALAVLRKLPSESVHCCVTSPPYWGLRDYGVKGQLGLEKTPAEFVERIVEIFREVRRVLRTEGTCWVNLGDTYATRGGGGWQGKAGERADRRHTQQNLKGRSDVGGLKPKDLAMIPARVAIALQADGWWIRQEIIWHKRNPMPESVTDRPTRSHEQIYLLTKSLRYFYDADAIKEPASPDTHARYARGRSNRKTKTRDYPGGQTLARRLDHMLPAVGPKAATSARGSRQNASFSAAVKDVVAFRNKRTVWTLSNVGYKGAHFATFPPELIRPCIRAGCPAGGVVLDPFFGSGTTGAVAIEEGRGFVGIELKREYVRLAKARVKKAAAAAS